LAFDFGEVVEFREVEVCGFEEDGVFDGREAFGCGLEKGSLFAFRHVVA
jgi:hypothetical protein